MKKTIRQSRKKTDTNIAGEHIPVLLSETLEQLDLKKGQTVVDCTTNRAGHSIEIAKRIGKTGTLICIDLDSVALDEAKLKLETLGSNMPTIYFVQDNFRNIQSILSGLDIKKVDRVIADLGLSSQELDISGRGFSFMRDEPLLMTFTSPVTDEVLTARDVVNHWSEKTIADILFHFSDERYAYRIAKKIVEYRVKKEIETTYELVDIINSAVPAVYKSGKTNSATKTFQALRMAVNSEIDSITELLNVMPDILNIDGRVSIITFHSTEDRTVKDIIRKLRDKNIRPLITKATKPSNEELEKNPRSRSAQLRTYIHYEN
jgi:16S rRNA (cytosine1402-N4)-methyltransferase